jgi:putative heme-binding domain-containing protein
MTHLIWLAAAEGDKLSQQLLRRLANHPDAEHRLQSLRALAEFPCLSQQRQIFLDALRNARPEVRLAALNYFISVDEPPPLAALVPPATSTDSYLRQAACLLLARRAPIEDILVLSRSRHADERLAGMLAAGMKLTTRPSDDVPPADLPLFFPKDNAFFHASVRYAGEERDIDLAQLGRIGSYASAERWNRIAHTLDEKKMFNLLVRALDDGRPAVQLQAAYYLSLLGDPRSEPLVAKARWDVKFRELSALPPREIIELWSVGPFDDGEAKFEAQHAPEQGAIDLTAEYETTEGTVQWEKTAASDGRFDWRERFVHRGPSSYYVALGLQSFRRQSVLVTIDGGDAVRTWHNGQPEAPGATSAPGKTGMLLDLQPGSNDVLVRVHGEDGAGTLRLRLYAAGEVVAVLPEKLDPSLLASRLKEAAAAGGQTSIAPEFLAIDWRQEIGRGDVAQGRKLFGWLGCVKCHAIAADQNGSGAPSLADARKRFTVSYLVESVLLPSRQVVELFRATTIETTDGQALSGLIVRETADEVEMLMPDATHRVVPTSEIESRQLQSLSPMPAAIVKTTAELRDLLAYLLSENPQAP